jgi:hypothetical protein
MPECTNWGILATMTILISVVIGGLQTLRVKVCDSSDQAAIITSSVLKMGASSLTNHIIGQGVKKLA